ncbi:MAG TPA: hypothetical protein VME41_08715 [Stellaceae bacterium]|nr:hypothetical protein [Stellaceae bacterium]
MLKVAVADTPPSWFDKPAGTARRKLALAIARREPGSRSPPRAAVQGGSGTATGDLRLGELSVRCDELQRERDAAIAENRELRSQLAAADARGPEGLMPPAFFKEKVQAEKQRDRALQRNDELAAALAALRAERDAAVAELAHLRREAPGTHSAKLEAALAEIFARDWPGLEGIELRLRTHRD